MDEIVALNIEKRPPCSRLTVAAWEQNNGASLPPDLKEFYASTDGFEMSWKYQNCNQKENKESKFFSRGKKKVRLINLIYLLTASHQSQKSKTVFHK